MRPVTGIDIDLPWFRGPCTDQIDHPAYGIGAIQRRSCTLDDLHSLHIVQIETAVVDIVQGLPCHTLPVHQKQDRIASEALHVESHLLVHCIGKLYTGKLCLEQVPYVEGINSPDIRTGYHTRQYGAVLQLPWSPGSGNYNCLQIHIVLLHDHIECTALMFRKIHITREKSHHVETKYGPARIRNNYGIPAVIISGCVDTVVIHEHYLHSGHRLSLSVPDSTCNFPVPFRIQYDPCQENRQKYCNTPHIQNSTG